MCCQIDSHIGLVDSDDAYHDIWPSVKSAVRWREREKDQMVKWPACRWKEENLYPGKCVKQSCSFITSQLKYLSDTRKHEMCYWSEFASEKNTRTAEENPLSNCSSEADAPNAARPRITAWRFSVNSSFSFQLPVSCHIHHRITTNEPRQIQHLVAWNHEKGNKTDNF